ncbi:hypothetical protein QQ045_018388 [Rhodiola kirilowii]
MMERWYVDISDWNPSPGEFSSAMSVLPQHEQSSITRYVRIEDRKMATVSRLLQYVLVHQVMGIQFDEIVIRRTVEGKPYLEYDGEEPMYPNFNFNVSHHGDFVGIASEPLYIVGLDIVSPVVPVNESVQDFIQHFSSYFTSLEWDRITNAGNSDEILTEFYRYWCLKEAFVKAIGAGLSYQVDKLEFHHSGWADLKVQISGRNTNEWKFLLHDLGKGHWASVAIGHPRYAAESFKKISKWLELTEEQVSIEIPIPNARFVKNTVEQLIQAAQKAISM